MLQQTRIETVIRYFNAFMAAFPIINTLADAELEKVYGVWAGMGYYQRAANLWKSAQIIQTEYNSMIPDEYTLLRKLPGIGDYTACAILSIAFNQPYPAVDGNVLRVVARLKGWRDNVLEKKTVEKTKEYLKSILNTKNCSAFTQAWMELGETLCSKQTPHCRECPIHQSCYANLHRMTDQLPVRVKNLERTTEHHAVFLIKVPPSAFLVTKKETGLLAGLWELPHIEIEIEETNPVIPQIRQYPDIAEPFHYIGSVRHDFTHKRWIMHVYTGESSKQEARKLGLQLFNLQELDQCPMATAFKKVLALYQKKKTDESSL